MLKSWNNPYSRVADSDEGDAEKTSVYSKRSRPSLTLIIGLTLLLLSTVVIIGEGFKDLALTLSNSETVQPQCSNPGLRREWRDLSPKDQRDYINAAQCFSTLANPHRSNGTLYDEFSRVHRSTGSFCRRCCPSCQSYSADSSSFQAHESASFLPWHRYFLHIYEKTLIAECDFRGNVPYWDWTLDSQAFSKSPIWDPDTGFGGNGNAAIGQGVGRGNCVTDGPFSTFRPVYYNQSYNPHCLSRGFGVGNDSEDILSHTFDPAAIDHLLRQETYENLLAQLEGSIHDSIHRLIGGDFRAWTAPNDPIFYLHHAQLDRLWWRWQQLEPNTRSSEYRGRHMVNSTGNAALTDRLFMDTLAVDGSVEDVMRSQGKLLCYDYV